MPFSDKGHTDNDFAANAFRLGIYFLPKQLTKLTL